METSYSKQASDFLEKTNTTIKVEFLKHDYHFDCDKEKRDIYLVIIQRGARKFSFNFGNSIHNSGEYIGHKNMCLNAFDKYLFTKEDLKNIRFQLNTYQIVKNKDFKLPDEYSILACLQKYDVGSLEDFCSEFGYDPDSKRAEKIYKSVCKGYDNVCKIWSDIEIEELQEIL
jgi:hypothetical protein